MSGFYNEILNHFRYDINEAENILKRIPPDGGLLKHYNKKLMLFNANIVDIFNI